MTLDASSPKPVSEATRERETFRYEQLSSPNYRYVRNGDLPPISDLTTAADSVLTGLAQLGAYQTDTARAFISLFDSTHQYIVAEAAPSMRIAAGLPNDGLPDSLSLRGAAIPRSQGTCDHVLSLGMDPDGVTGDTELPLSFVPNLAQDGRFSSRPYCQFPGDGQFYAGVPIRTRKGINIGAYCVMSAVAPPGWGKQHDQRLRDISRAIMSHLEFRRYSHEIHRYERFSRGLAAFVGGRSGGRNSQDIGNPLNRFPGGAGTPGYDGQDTQGSLLTVGDQHDYELPGPDSTMIPDGSLQKSDSSSPMSSYFTHLSFLPSVDQIPLAADPPFKPSIRIPARNTKDPDVVFSDAAGVLQKTFNVDGCVFLNVTLGSRRPAGPSKSGAALDGSNIVPEGGAGFTSSSDEHNNGLYGDPADGICDRLGIATRAALDPKQLVSDGDSTSVGQMSRAFLAKLLKRYPNGKVFNFDAAGELQSSDSSEEDATRPVMLATPASEEHHRINPAASAQPSGSKRSRQPREGAFIQQAFSGARSVMFVPVWDPKRERWLSGGFVYSMAAAHSFSPNEDLGLMLAFCKVVSAEFLHMETQRTDKAKSDALGSLSHELRSPLHGIVLSTEMLNDTDLTVYQSNATHTIETCCRTLLDTIDHLLDYSKVNSLALTSSKVGFGPVAQQNASIPATSLPSSFGKKSLYKHIRLDGLVEDVVVSVFAGFNIEYLSPEHVGSASNSKSSVSKNSSNRMTKLPASGVGTFVRQSVGKESSTNVTVYVTADPDCNWMLHVHAGAWRRIVMNLVGNSLKYTPSGMIKVSLSQEDSRRLSTQKIIKLTVSDTGCGIGKDFLQHSLFQPFSQENAMSPGIGLGLSLVKKMVSQLRGRIKVRSSEGEGTTIQVTLPYDSSTHVSQDSPGLLSEQDELFQKQLSDLQGLRISIDGFDLTWGSEGRSLVEMVCQRWLGLRLVSDEGISPDVLLRSEDELVRPDNSLVSPLAKVPMIVVCRDAAAAWQLYKAHETIDYAGRVVEFVSQPIAPRSLARAILHAYQRWVGLSESVLLPRPQTLRRAHSLGMEPMSPPIITTLEVPVITTKLPASETKTHARSQSPPHISLPKISSPVAPSHHDDHGQKHDSVPAIRVQEKRTLLLVDDNKINLKVLSVIVAKLGFDYQLAMNGQEALDIFLQYPGRFSALLLDISMPVMDGLEATRRVRTHEHNNHLVAVPVLTLTGLSSDSTHKEALESGVNVFLTKPVKSQILREALESVGLSMP